MTRITKCADQKRICNAYQKRKYAVRDIGRYEYCKSEKAQKARQINLKRFHYMAYADQIWTTFHRDTMQRKE